ncbi:MAG: LytTR family transcriptional regulator [Bacteroidales bacterium]|nr:LytTR family transcriptional regulator [Bacteroidales bacterium]
MDLNKPIPGYLIEKKNIVSLVVFTAAFAILFINIYSPFEINSWKIETKLTLLTFSSLITLVGVLIVVFSRVMMYYIYRNKSLQLWKYLIWIFCEIACMALTYSIFVHFFLKDPRDFAEILQLNLRNASLILLLPYAISWLYFAWKDKDEQIERLTENQSLSGSTGANMIAFYDEKQELRLSVKKESLLYLESAENYISICYINKNKISKYLIRNTLKKMEEQFANTSIMRCHRSYMVNLDNVKVVRKENDALFLELDSPTPLDIPVSRSYISPIMQAFSKYYGISD